MHKRKDWIRRFDANLAIWNRSKMSLGVVRRLAYCNLISLLRVGEQVWLPRCSGRCMSLSSVVKFPVTILYGVVFFHEDLSVDYYIKHTNLIVCSQKNKKKIEAKFWRDSTSDYSVSSNCVLSIKWIKFCNSYFTHTRTHTKKFYINYKDICFILYWF